MLVLVGVGMRDDQIVNEDELFAGAIGSLAQRWFWWFLLGGIGAIRFGDVQISPLGWVTAPLVLIALWRLSELASGSVRHRLHRALGCGLIAAVAIYVAAPALPDARWVLLAVGCCLLMVGMAAFAGGMRTWVEQRGCEPRLVNIWAWAGRWAWANAVAVAGVAVVGAVLDGTNPTMELDGWAALAFVPLCVVAIAPFFAAAMATDDLRKGLDRQFRLSG